MKNKKIIIGFIFILLIIGIIFFIITHLQKIDPENNSEYTPEEEISDEQLQQTMVTLYFIESEKNTLKAEGRLISSKDLLSDPYKELVSLLLIGPKTAGLKKALPEDTRILSATLEKNCVTLDFSQEILNFENDDQKFNIINTLLNTLSQLNEVNSIKIIINGEINDTFSDEYSNIISR